MEERREITAAFETGVKAQEEPYKSGSVQYIDSREVALIIEKNHADLIRDIRRYAKQLTESNIAVYDFFTESSYIGCNGKKNKCYLVTKKGCEFIAHKLTGIKGTKFTATYINRFHEMEGELQKKTLTTLEKFIEMQQESDNRRDRAIKALVKRQDTFDKWISEQENEENQDTSTAGRIYTFRVQEDVLNERMSILNDLVDQVSDLYSMKRNRVLHAMYNRIQELEGVALNPYLRVMKKGNTSNNICNLHVIASIDRFYEMAVDMSNFAIERKLFHLRADQ